MHIAVVSLGAFGHVNPTLSFVKELVDQGVRITYFCTEEFRRIVEPTGAKFVAVPSWMADNDKHNEDKTLLYHYIFFHNLHIFLKP
jgi:UDP:flavonoid glycosyltransferase YjiC (YdhE family)